MNTKTELYNVDRVKLEWEIIESLIKYNFGSKDVLFDFMEKPIEGELPEFCNRKTVKIGYCVIGNRELIVYLDGIEEPTVYFLDTYSGQRTLSV